MSTQTHAPTKTTSTHCPYCAFQCGMNISGSPAEAVVYELLDSLGQDDGVRSLMVFGSNVVVSAPNAVNVKAKLRSLDFLVVDDFFLSETAELADVVLPTAQWAEEVGVRGGAARQLQPHTAVGGAVRHARPG